MGAHRLHSRFHKPKILGDVTAKMTVTREETFGPPAPVTRFETDEEAIASANTSKLCVVAYTPVSDIARLWRIAGATESGIVGISTPLNSTDVAPFGGVKSSAFGREGSPHRIDDFLELKYLRLAM